MALVVLALSSLLQLIAAALALSLIRVTGRRLAWLLISGAILLMAARRLISLAHALFEGGASPDLTAELVALLISAVLLAGIAAIRPLLESMVSSTREAGRMSRLLSTVLTGLEAGIYVIDVESGELLFKNEKLREMLGEEALAAQCRRTGNETRPWCLACLENPGEAPLAVGDGSFSREFFHEPTRRWFATSECPISWTDGRRACLAMLTDMTERKRAEQALAESEARLRALFRALPDIHFVLDDKGNYHESMVPGGQDRHLQWRGGSVVGRNVADVFDEPTARRIMEAIGDTVATGRVQRVEYRLSLDEGDRWYEGRTSLLPHRSDEEHRLLVWVARDITERRKAEQLKEDIERMTRHDLKSPLLASVSVAKMLGRSHNLTEDQFELVQELKENGERMLAVINRSMDLYRMEAGRYEFTPVRVDLVQAVKSALTELRELARRKEIEVELSCGGEPVDAGRRLYSMSDEALLHTMLANLLKNALEASPEGERVRVSLAGNDVCTIEIANKGEVPEPIRHKFFEKYTTHGKPYGTGLGAYSARLIARTLKGRVELEDKTPGTTTIRVTLPGNGETGTQAEPAER